MRAAAALRTTGGVHLSEEKQQAQQQQRENETFLQQQQQQEQQSHINSADASTTAAGVGAAPARVLVPAGISGMSSHEGTATASSSYPVSGNVGINNIPPTTTANLTLEQLAAVALPPVPTVREVSAAGILLLLQEVVSYAARRSNGNKEDTIALLDSQGFCVGVRLLERLALRSQQRIIEQRECLKFVCKDLWQLLFQKQADRLQTNRRGGYVIQDHSLAWLRRLSPIASSSSAAATTTTTTSAAPPASATSSRGLSAPTAGIPYNREAAIGTGVTVPPPHPPFPADARATRGLWTGSNEQRQYEPKEEGRGGFREDTDALMTANASALLAQQLQQNEAAASVLCHQPAVHVALLCGIIRGALAGMGLTCTVSADTASSPYCSFQVRITPS